MSYGTNAPQGLQPQQHQNGSLWNDQLSPYKISDQYTTSLFKGDPVTLAAGYLAIGVAGAAIIGVFWGCKYINSIGTYIFSPFWPASTVTQAAAGADAFVVDDPTVLFNIQTSLAGITQASIGSNANFLAGSGSTITGQSGYTLDSSTIATANPTRSLKIVALTPNVSNAFGVNYNNALVKINNDVYNGGTGTAGI
jgi:hypothetical protein